MNTRPVPVCKTAFALIAGLLSLPTLTGCSMDAIQLSGSVPTDASSVSLQGNVHGGQQGVSGSTINLFAVGQSGYGSIATSLLNSGVTVTTDKFGYFGLTGQFKCPTATPAAMTYITATGGNPGLTAGTNNSAIKLVAALGPCNGLTSSTFIDINEVTTAAAAFALGQYFGTSFAIGSNASNGLGDSFGAPSTTQGQTGITNAFTTVNNLVTLSNGTAITAGTVTGTAGVLTTAPDAAKLYTIADILAACINSNGSTAAGSNCGTLFADTPPTGGTTPSNTLEAAVYLSLNPTSTNSASGSSASNVSALYGLESPTSPFVGMGLATAPTDWTIGIQYTSATIFPQAQNIAADASGNIWVTNNQGGTNGSLVQLLPSGAPNVNTPEATTVSGTATSLATNNPRNVAVDLSGNVYVTTSSGAGYVFEYTPSSGNVVAVAAGKAPYGLAIDGSNDVWTTQQSSSSTYELTEYIGGTLSSTSQVQFPLVGQSAISASVTSNTFVPQYAAFDFNGNLWFDSGTTSSTSAYILSNINTSGCAGTFPCQVTSSSTANTYTTLATSGLSTPFGLAANTNSMWIVDNGTGNVSDLTLAGANNTGSPFGPTSSATTPAPRFIATDGSGNLWVTNRGTGALSEFSASGTLLSPSAGFAHSGLNTANGVTVDPSGNVWVANNTTSASAVDPNSVFELVGAATPVVTPLAQQVKNKAIAKP